MTEPAAPLQYFAVSSGDGPPSAEQQAVMVPGHGRKLVPRSPERVRRIREHLVRSLRELRVMKQPERNASPLRPPPVGFAGDVARAACTMCRGYCCKGGGEHAYLDERTMARVRMARPELVAAAVIRLYTASIPAEGYDGSCVFHGEQGCTLDRSLRSDVCNSYFCNSLGDFVKSSDSVRSAMIMSGGDGELRLSRVITR